MNYLLILGTIILALAIVGFYISSGTHSKPALLGVIFIIFLLMLFLYYYAMSSQTTLTSSVYLMTANAPIPTANIPSPLATSYSYATWVYVNSWNTTNNKTLFTVQDTQTNASFLDVVIGGTQLTLTANIWCNGQPISVVGSKNFPLQKWTLVIVSVDGSVVDIYLDGKLTVSAMLQNSNQINVVGDTSQQPQVVFGTGYDIYLSKLIRSTNAMTPPSAHSLYLQGNGQGWFSSIGLSGYGVDLEIKQNNIPTQSITIV